MNDFITSLAIAWFEFGYNTEWFVSIYLPVLSGILN